MVIDTVEGVARAEFDILLAPTPRRSPQVIKHERRRDDSRTGIEAEATHFENIRLTARLILLLEDVHVVAARCQAHGGCKAAKTGPNDDNGAHL
jgi:hypothetical protein